MEVFVFWRLKKLRKLQEQTLFQEVFIIGAYIKIKAAKAVKDSGAYSINLRVSNHVCYAILVLIIPQYYVGLDIILWCVKLTQNKYLNAST